MSPENELQNKPIQVATPAQDTVREQDKIMLVFAYLGLLALIPLLTVKDSDFVKWHAKNGLVLWVGGFVAMTVIGALPFIRIFSCLLFLAIVVVAILGVTKALAGQRWRIPGVSDLAEKF